ncbi:hypothetical protein BOTBODRAFT_63501 [Botryobasidium botryosum FD-172 SS1]|uniref:U three protein 7 n=1 Tax=Botryobasidium botryosum (strain FD-172 SS1) TaxID=930990 RepID=A0A067MS84_BOTB1|nr:hypothetical protein BOTBODRAFT_63501 [Botryobasidium botryosum FD-172 SS1]
MDALISKADAIKPLDKKAKRARFFKGQDRAPGEHKKKEPVVEDATAASISRSTRLPPSLVPHEPSKVPSNSHIKDVKLRSQLTRTAKHTALTKELLKDAELLRSEERGRIEVEGQMEKTWRVTQDEIVKSVGVEVAAQRKEWKLDGGSYRTRYTRNGRHLAIAGKKGHVATFDWQTGTLHSELQLQETVRDITFLQDQSFIAVAQKQYVYIYDQSGVEIHRLSSHVEVNRLEFLPWHWLLVSVGNAGYLKYTDTSTGQTINETRTKLGACNAMVQNMHNAVIYLGHQNGTVTLRTPNLSTPPVTLLAHLGPITSLSVDPSSGGRYLATAGVDNRVKVWDCRNWKGCVREWTVRGGGGGGSKGIGTELEWSQKGLLAVASGGTVNVYAPPTIHSAHKGMPPLYLNHPIPHRPLTSVRFCPFTDVLTLGHAAGLSSIIVPGAGEGDFDSAEADPFEARTARREREVRGLLDKIQPELITLDPEFIGSLAPQEERPTYDQLGKKVVAPYARLPRLERLRVSGKADETEVGEEKEQADGGGEEDGMQADESPKQTSSEKPEKVKMKMKGKGKSMKRWLSKKRKNVIDPSTVAIRQKIEAQKETRRRELKAAKAAARGGEAEVEKPSALDRFRK